MTDPTPDPLREALERDPLDKAERAALSILHPFDHPRIHRVFQDLRAALQGDADSPVGGLRVRPEWLDTLDDTFRLLNGERRFGLATRVQRLRKELAAATSSADAGAGGLAEAWEAAEAALPEGWRLLRVEVTPRNEAGWRAEAQSDPFRTPYKETREVGPTPAAALRALAARFHAADEGALRG